MNVPKKISLEARKLFLAEFCNAVNQTTDFKFILKDTAVIIFQVMMKKEMIPGVKLVMDRLSLDIKTLTNLMLSYHSDLYPLLEVMNLQFIPVRSEIVVSKYIQSLGRPNDVTISNSLNNIENMISELALCVLDNEKLLVREYHSFYSNFLSNSSNSIKNNKAKLNEIKNNERIIHSLPFVYGLWGHKHFVAKHGRIFDLCKIDNMNYIGINPSVNVEEYIQTLRICKGKRVGYTICAKIEPLHDNLKTETYDWLKEVFLILINNLKKYIPEGFGVVFVSDFLLAMEALPKHLCDKITDNYGLYPFHKFPIKHKTIFRPIIEECTGDVLAYSVESDEVIEKYLNSGSYQIEAQLNLASQNNIPPIKDMKKLEIECLNWVYYSFCGFNGKITMNSIKEVLKVCDNQKVKDYFLSCSLEKFLLLHSPIFLFNKDSKEFGLVARHQFYGYVNILENQSLVNCKVVLPQTSSISQVLKPSISVSTENFKSKVDMETEIKCLEFIYSFILTDTSKEAKTAKILKTVSCCGNKDIKSYFIKQRNIEEFLLSHCSVLPGYLNDNGEMIYKRTPIQEFNLYLTKIRQSVAQNIFPKKTHVEKPSTLVSIQSKVDMKTEIKCLRFIYSFILTDPSKEATAAKILKVVSGNGKKDIKSYFKQRDVGTFLLLHCSVLPGSINDNGEVVYKRSNLKEFNIYLNKLQQSITQNTASTSKKSQLNKPSTSVSTKPEVDMETEIKCLEFIYNSVLTDPSTEATAAKILKVVSGNGKKDIKFYFKQRNIEEFLLLHSEILPRYLDNGEIVYGRYGVLDLNYYLSNLKQSIENTDPNSKDRSNLTLNELPYQPNNNCIKLFGKFLLVPTVLPTIEYCDSSVQTESSGTVSSVFLFPG